MRPVGKPSDTASSSGSLHAKVRNINAGSGNILCLPTGAAGTTLTAGASWVAGSYGELDDGSGVTVAVKAVGLALDTPSAAFVGEVTLATGAGSSEVDFAVIPLEVATDAGDIPTIFFPPCGEIAASTRIAAKFATAGGSTTINAKVILQAIG